MGRNKKSNYHDVNASIGNKDFFGTIYDGMLKSKEYQSLSIGAKQFYTLCRVQSQSPQGTSCLYQHNIKYNRNYEKSKDFVFPASHLLAYGIKRQNALKYFKELEAAGFIITKERNQKQKIVNVYSFSDKWKNTS